MSSACNSPKSPILHGSKFSPSIERPSQPHRAAFHLSNFFHSITKFSRTIRTNNAFARSTSTNPANQHVKLTRRSFTKTDSLSSSSSIHRPSSCFILLSPSKREHQNCLFFQKPNEQTISPKLNPISSFKKIKRVSSFLLPLKRRQSLSLNHSLHERSFKAKESTKRRSRLLNYSIFKHQTPIFTPHSTSLSGSFGYHTQPKSLELFPPPSILLDLIQIDLIVQIRLNNSLSTNYQSILSESPPWSLIQILHPFHGIALEKQLLILFQPKLFDANPPDQQITPPDFLYLPLHQIKYEENDSIHIGYEPFSPSTIRIPLKWISQTPLFDYEISSKVCSIPLFRNENFCLFSDYSR